MNFKEFIEELGWSKNKFFENIERICSKAVYDIDIGKFRKAGEEKEEYLKDEINFCFKSQWKEIAYVLFTMFAENPFYRKNSTANSVTLEDVINYNIYSLKIIEQELPDYHRRQIQLHPTYAATLIETKAMKKVSEKIRFLLSSISKMPIETRTEIWVNFDKIINYQLIQSYLSTINAKEKIEEDKGTLFKNQLFGEYEHISLDKYVAQVLKKEMEEEFVKERDRIGELHTEAQNDLDEMYIKISQDTPEEMEAINKTYNDLGLDRLIKQTQARMMENLIKERLKEASAMIENSTSVDHTIDEIINDLENADGIDSRKQIEKLKEVKAMVSKNSKEIEKFSSIADKILCELNYNIINRK